MHTSFRPIWHSTHDSRSLYEFAHRDAKYFSVDKIGQDQLADMAKRRAVSEQLLAQWLAPNLS